MIGRGRAEFLEEGAPPAMRVEIARPIAGIAAGDLGELVEIGGKALEVGVDDRVRPIGRDDAAGPAAVSDHQVPLQVVERAFRGGDRFDVEALEQGTRPVAVLRKQRGDRVVVAVGRRGAERLVDAEQVGQHMVEPQPGRRSPEQMIVAGEQPPDLAPVGLDRRAVAGRHAEILEPHALAEQHAEDVVVRHDEQLRGIGERLVQRIPARVGVAVRADDRQVLDAGMEVAGNRPRPLFGGEQQIGIDQLAHGSGPLLLRPAIGMSGSQ